MKTNQISMAFDDEKELQDEWIQLDKVIRDRGSKYSITAGRIENNADLKKFLQKLKSNKKYQKASHNSYALRVKKDGKIFESKNDDGETGAGMVILRQIQKSQTLNIVVVVTRWFGGTMLHGDRFKHIQDGTKMILEEIQTR